jgi:ferredoxin-NADP reductase/MOSC domain-containing protein YiiM
VYQIESYRYWEEQLGRDGFTYGQFGENFTVEGLPDDEVCIGDRYRIGDAVFEVTQPRVTCYRVGIRMDEPQMPSLLVSHRRPGFYLRVLQEGEVQAGDEITKLTTGPEAMTVAEMDGLLYLPRHPRHSLARALRIPALSPGWRESFRTLLDQGPGSGNQALNPAAGARPAWSGFRPFRVAGVDRESASVISICLVPLAHPAPSPAQPGQFVTVRVRPDAKAAPLLRSYSLSGPPDGDGYRISVKREAHGAASAYLHSRLGVGDTLELAAPRGAFVLQPGDRPVVLVSAGVGATPVLAMLHALAEERSRRQVWWLHGARSRAEHSFAREVDDLLAVLPDAHRLVCYSNPGPDDRAGLDFDVQGRLNAQVLDDAAAPTDGAFYLCGPSPFMDEVGAALAARGVTPDRINVEVFGSSDPITPGIVGSTGQPPHPPEGPPGPGPEISFSRSNLTVSWDPAFPSLLELAEACDVPVRWSCRSGVCHTCETGLVSGTVSYLPDPVEDAGPGNAYLCCSQPKSDLVLDL